MLPIRHQVHFTVEPTIGVSPDFAIGFLFLNAWEPGYTPQFAGWRVLPHFYLPESWDLPLPIGFVSEFSFQNTRYEENSRRVELRPILEREFEGWQIVFKRVFERALHGLGTERGWNFEPALLFAGNGRAFLLHSNTTAKWKASMSARTHSRRYTSMNGRPTCPWPGPPCRHGKHTPNKVARSTGNRGLPILPMWKTSP